jgi:hypothetical protein
MSLVFFITLTTSLIAFGLIKRDWLAAPVGLASAVLIAAGFLALHGTGSAEQLIEAIKPTLPDGLLAALIVFAAMRLIRRKHNSRSE